MFYIKLLKLWKQRNNIIIIHESVNILLIWLKLEKLIFLHINKTKQLKEKKILSFL